MTDIVKVESFQGIPVRVVQHNGQGMIPLNDIADGITHDRSGLRKLFHRNEEIVGKWSGKVNLATPQGTSQEQICLNHDGVTAMLMKVDYARVKDPVRRKRIIDFQEWAASTLSKIVKGEIIQITDPVSTSLLRNAGYADILIERYKWTREQANVFAFSRVQDETKVIIQDKPAIQHGEVGWYNATQLGLECGLTAEQLNMWLYNKGYIYRFGTVWRLQPVGEAHGREYTFEAPSGHREPRIAWRVSILEAAGLVRHPEQQALPGARV